MAAEADPRALGRPVIVGMNNPRSVAPEHALYPLPAGCAGNRLFEMLRLAEPSATMFGYCDRFERVNLVVGPWDAARARERAVELRPSLAGRSVVLLGREVAKAFGVLDVRSFLSLRDDALDSTFYLLPHPSGRNLLYNDPDVRLEAGRVLARLYEGST